MTIYTTMAYGQNNINTLTFKITNQNNAARKN